jgi:predicted DNA-binding protein (MmcQ/YjbR family)
MNLETFRDYCLQKDHVDESFPFDENTLVFKFNNKIFASVSLKDERNNSCNLKCDPERALLLREQFGGIVPGYHSNKKHWNTLSFNEDVSDQLIFELVDHSYQLLFQSFSKKVQKELNECTNR